MKRRIVSVLTALALLLSLCPTWAFATEADPALCKHHPEHVSCGYVAPTEGQPCRHVHTDGCYTEETLCVHAHDETCYSDGLLPNEGEEKAADGSWSCGDSVTATLTGGTLTVSGTGAMTDYSYASDAPWDSNRSNVTKVKIETGVTHIAKHAFHACSNLTSVTIAADVGTIGEQAFYNCAKLNSVVLPEGLTTIGNLAFSGCTSLPSVNLPDSVTSMQSAFSGCTSLESANIPSSMTTISGAAFQKSGLRSITIPDTVTTIENNVFRDCTSLQSIEIPESVTSFGMYIFDGCTSLTSVTLPGNLGVIEDYMFRNCTSLESIEIPASVTRIDAQAFQGCTNLANVEFKRTTAPTLKNANTFDGIPDGAIKTPHGSAGYDSGNWASLGEKVQKHVITDGVCTCGARFGASVTTSDGASRDYETIQEAWEAANSAGTATVTLLADVTVTSGLTVNSGQNITFEGGSFTLAQTLSEGETANMTHAALNVAKGGTLTVKNGKITSQDIGLNAYQGTLYVEGGEISGDKTGLFYGEGCHISGGKLTGGENAAFMIIAKADVRRILLNFGANEADKHYAFYQNGSPYVPTGAVLPAGTYTVMECQHTGVEVTDLGNGKHGLTCPYCGFERAAEPHNFNETGYCPDCKLQAAAKVTAGGTTSYYDDLKEAWAAAQSAGTATVTLLADATLTGELSTNPRDGESLTPNITFNGGNHTVTGYPGQRIFSVESGSTLTITGGTFKAKPDEKGRTSGCVDVKSGGTLIVTNGTLEMEGTSGYMLLAQDGSTTHLSGGTFKGGENPVLCQGNLLLKGLLLNYGSETGPHYAFYQGSSPYVLSGNSLPSGTFTVQECQHKDVKPTSNNNGTHALNCPYCGYIGTAENCTYDFSGTTTGTCKACGDSVTVAISDTENLIYDGTEKKPGVTVTRNGTTLAADTDYTVVYGNNKNAGENKATVTVTIGNKQGTYTGYFSIGKAPLTIKANDQTITYGESITEGTDQVTPATLCTGDTLQSVTLAASTENVPGGTIAPSAAQIQNSSGADVTGNYEIAYQPGALTISKADVSLTTTPAANTLTYTGEAQALVSGGTASVGEVVYSLTEEGPYSTTIPTGTNAGSYTVWYKVEGNANYNGIDATSIPVTISRKAVTPTVTITPDRYEYTGSAIQPSGSAVKVLDGTKEIPASEYTLSYGENIHVGTGTVTVTDSGSGNYQITETTQTFTITKKLQETLSITGKPGTTAYGDTFTLTTGGGSGEGAVTWSVTGPATVSSTGEVKITGVGRVTVTADKAGGDDYEDAQATLTFEAAKKTVTAVVTAANKTYDGNTSATVTASVNNTGLVTGDSITITGVTGTFDNANAGTGKTVTVNSTGASISGTNAEKYQVTFPASTTADIEKADASVTTAPTARTLAYTGEAQALVSGGTASVGEVVYSLTEAGTYSTTIPTGTNAGSYTVWYKIADTDNYNGTAPVKVDVTISKVNYTGEKEGSTSGRFGREKTYDLKNLLPEGYKLGTPTKTDTNNIFDGDPIVNGATLTYKLADSAEVGKTGKITVPVTESTNYNPFDLTITVTVTDKIVPTLTVNPITVAYTGSAVSASAIQGTATAEGKTIPGSWKFADGQALTNVADSGTKTVIFTPTDEAKADYASATGTVRVTITKATPSLTLTPSPATLPNGGTVTLALSGLPSGGSATVTCSEASITVAKGSGDTWTAELPAGGASYTFTATYAGDGNHNSATANCTVSVDKITPTLSLTASPAAPLTGGGTVTLTLSGLPAGGTASVTCSGGITVTAGTGNTWTATLPNSTATYTFTASYAGSDTHHSANASCTVETKEVVILPNPPADDDGTKFQLVMETGIDQVPDGLKGIETLNTPEKLETAMKTEITQATPGIPEANTAVYDVVLMVSTDGGVTWTKATEDNFPSGGLTITLPYPSGTNSSYLFTVVHMFTTSAFNKTPGNTEVFTPNQVRNTAQGIQVVVTGLSPISVGWTAPATTPDTPSGGNHSGGGGGGWTTSTYAVTVEKSEHGKVTSNRTNASSGSIVTLTVTPDSGYVLDTLTVTDSRGNEIKLTAQGSGKYTFTMPSRAVTVKATFAPLPDDTQKPCDGGADCPSRGFTDLGSVGTWYHEAVDYVLRNGLMGGYGNGLFGPNNNLTRAQFAQILFNREGKPVVNYLLQYGDVAEGAWYTEAIRWATSRGIIGGYGNRMFGPNDNITREQLAVMLWRYAGSPAATDKELHFTDKDKISGYALEALRWAVENGIMGGYGDGRLGPQGLATRAQVAQMLKNFLENREDED